MTDHLEDLVREAQQRLAERAVHPDRVRAALPARAARRARQRRYGAVGLAAVAAAVVVAVAAPVLALRGGSGGPPPLQVGAQPASPTAPAPRLGAAPLAFRPTWLPTGWTERVRRSSVDTSAHPRLGPVSRMWTTGPVGTDGTGGGNSLSLDSRAATGPADPGANSGTPVDIGGQRGYLHDAGGKSYVEWRTRDGRVVSLQQHGSAVSTSDLLRVARSVRPDTGQLRPPLALGWLPADLSVCSVEVSGDSPTSWFARLDAEVTVPVSPTPDGAAAKMAPRDIMVTLSPTTTAPAGGQRLTVSGHPARLVTRTDIPELNMRYLVVDLGAGRLLTVIAQWPGTNPITQADMVKVAEHASLDPTPDVSWIGTA